ncbi:hypothetical protein PoMZ_13501 [Pyricularia oryzae]|uniref:Uncharacterized protein n=1 Tax=Pyricularia oryzae TaxID=318829 RepID=A0A4P7NVN0_PYROR|nr:hypothetical protein PoMZ_13501 [Pyricularia oryzae]
MSGWLIWIRAILQASHCALENTLLTEPRGPLWKGPLPSSTESVRTIIRKWTDPMPLAPTRSVMTLSHHGLSKRLWVLFGCPIPLLSAKSPPSIPAAFANISLKSRPGTQAWPILVEKDVKFRGDEFLERPTPLGLLLLQGWLIITHVCDKMAYFGISGPDNSLVFKVSVLMRRIVALVFALLQLLKYLFGRRPTMMAIKID